MSATTSASELRSTRHIPKFCCLAGWPIALLSFVSFRFAHRYLKLRQIAGGPGDGKNLSDWDSSTVAYAKYIGIDPQREPHLMWIAQEGLQAPLPAGWAEATSPQGTTYYCK